MMPFEPVALKLGLKDPPPRLRETWDASQLKFGSEIAQFAAPPQIIEACRALGMPEAFMDAALKAVHEVRADEALSRYLWHCRRLLTELDSGWPAMGAGFPVIRPDASPGAGMGYALVFLNLFRTAQRRFRDRGVPEAVALDTLRDFNRWVDDYRRKHGAWGLWNLGWLQHHLRARIFTLGRLQFKIEEYAYDFHGWRQRDTHRVLLLAGDGMVFHPDGYFADADRAVQPVPGAWSAVYEEDIGRVRGMPATPLGRVCREPVTLPRPEWQPVLRKGNATVGIHIPGGSPMDYDACGDSFARVRGFFARHVPEHPVTALTCGSWLLDTQFEGALPDSSNVVRFLREMYLHPLPGATDQALFDRVFAGRRPAPDEPETGMTSMQRAVVRVVRAGGKWRSGASLLFPDDLNWGSRVYRAMWPDAIRSLTLRKDQAGGKG